MNNNWIETKSELPSTRTRVLFMVSGSYAGTHPKEGIFVKNYENEHGAHGSIFVGADNSWNPLHTVSHWMNLPEPPK